MSVVEHETAAVRVYKLLLNPTNLQLSTTPGMKCARPASEDTPKNKCKLTPLLTNRHPLHIG